MSGLSTSYWAADTSRPIVDMTVGDLLRAAAAAAPATTALVEGGPDPHRRRRWRLIDAFPLTPSGKVKKYVLREELIADLGDAARVSGPDITSAAPPPERALAARPVHGSIMPACRSGNIGRACWGHDRTRTQAHRPGRA